MRRGYQKLLTIESKAFVLSVVGSKEDSLKITENGRGRRFFILLPEDAVLWLLRAWTRFRTSQSVNWCNQMRKGSRVFMLESRSNRAGKYLQLSVFYEGKRSFVILPAGWKEWGWFKMFGVIAELVGQVPLAPPVKLSTSAPPPSSPLGTIAPPPPLTECCPKCGFKGKPASFRRSFAEVVSSSAARRGKEVSDEGFTLDQTEPLAVQRRNLSSGTVTLNQQSLNSVLEPKRAKVYSRRNRPHGFKWRVKGGILSEKVDSGGVDASADALLASILDSQLDSLSTAGFSLYDPATFEAAIHGQPSKVVGFARAKDVSLEVSGVSKGLVMGLLPNAAPHGSPPTLTILPRFRDLGDPLTPSMEGSPFFGGGGLDVSAPREAIRDTLALCAAPWNLEDCSGGDGARGELEIHDPTFAGGPQSGSEHFEAPLAVDFSFIQNSNVNFSAADVWDGHCVNSDKVSKWVDSKIQGIASCIGVAVSGYETEVIQLLSRIERNNRVSKQSAVRTPLTTRKQRELRRLEFGVNYDRDSASSSGPLVPYV